MSKILKTNKLIESVIRRAQLPTTQNTFRTEDFLAFANEEMDMGLVPHVLSHHEDYLLFTEYTDTDPTTQNYRIPHRAMGNKLRDVALVDEHGTTYELTRVLIEDVPTYSMGSVHSYTYYPGAFYVKGDEIIIIANSQLGNNRQLAFTYYIRSNELVEETRVGTVSTIEPKLGDPDVTVITTFSTLPTVFASGLTVDFVDYKTPFKHLGIDIEITITGTNEFEIATEFLPSSLKRGDYVALAEEIHVPQVPQELHPVLAQRVAARCLEAINDQSGLAAANVKLKQMEDATGMIIDDRVESAPLKVQNNHGFLKLRRNRFWRT